MPTKQDNRPSWDEYFMDVAYATAKRSTCPKRAVGAVIVSEQRIISTGYNGAPAGAPHCPGNSPDGHPDCLVDGRCVRTIHAETNAVIFAGLAARGASIYTTTFPCLRCMGIIINAGIKEVIYAENYSQMSVSALLAKQTGVSVRGLTPELPSK